MSLAARLFPDEFYREADLRLVQAVPSGALDILDAEGHDGALAEVLRHLAPTRQVLALAETLPPAPEHYTRLLTGMPDDAIAQLAPGTLDAILVGPRTLADPARLAALRPALRPQGELIVATPNAQHWSQFDRLLRGEAIQGLSAPQCLRALLDAGFLPQIVDRRVHALPDTWLAALPSLTEHLRLGLPTCLARSQTLTYIISARPLPEVAHTDVAPVTFGVCTNDPAVLADNFLASPDLQDETHEVITVNGAESVADGLKTVLSRARHELVVQVHQDVYLPRGWIARLWAQYALARQQTDDRVGVMGVYGVRGTAQGIVRAGRVADRDTLLDEATPLPVPVSSLDELVLIVPRRSTLHTDPALGFHLYGTDLALAAEAAGLVALVIDAPCHHNSQLGNELPAAFHASAAVLRARWPDRLPLATPCMLLR